MYNFLAILLAIVLGGAVIFTLKVAWGLVVDHSKDGEYFSAFLVLVMMGCLVLVYVGGLMGSKPTPIVDTMVNGKTTRHGTTAMVGKIPVSTRRTRNDGLGIIQTPNADNLHNRFIYVIRD